MTDTIEVSPGQVVELQFSKFELISSPYMDASFTITDGDGTPLMEESGVTQRTRKYRPIRKNQWQISPANFSSLSNVVHINFTIIGDPDYVLSWRLQWSARTPGNFLFPSRLKYNV